MKHMFEDRTTQASAHGPTTKLIEFARALNWSDLPADVSHAAKRHLLDTCGAIIGGMRMDVATKIATVSGVVRHCESGIPVPGSQLRLDAPNFAFVCGTAAHGIELDDGYREGSVHPGVNVVPAARAIAYERNATGKALLESLIIGYETITATAGAAHPAIRDRGFHPTSAVGPFGACLAAGRLLGLDKDTLQNAMGIAASGSAGLFAFLDGGGDVKRLHAGQSSRAGLLAALFAEAGISGPNDVIEIGSGFSQAFAYGDRRDLLQFEMPPAAPYRTARCYIKPYSCCRHLQPAIDALLEIMAEQSLIADDIAGVEVEAYSIAASHAETGWSDFASAQLSFHYVLAVAMAKGSVDLVNFDASVRADPNIAALACRVTVKASAEMDALYPRQRPSRVKVTTRKGAFSAFAREALGAPEKPVDDRRLQTKFLSLTEPVLGKQRAREAIDRLWSIDTASSVRPLLASLSAGQSADGK